MKTTYSTTIYCWISVLFAFIMVSHYPSGVVCWTVTAYQSGVPLLQPIPELVLSAADETPSRIELRFTNDDNVIFSQDLEQDRTVLLGSCASKQGADLNQFGWNYWQQNFSFLVSVNLNVISLMLTQQAGFSPTVMDTVTCAIGNPGIGGRVYAQSPLSPLDLTVSFSIAPSTSVTTKIYFPGATSSFSASTSVAYPETKIRNDGLDIRVWMRGDCWNPKYVPQVLQFWDCLSTDTSTCDVVRSLLRNPAFLSYSNSAPHLLKIFVPRTITRSINPSSDLKISFVLPTGSGQMYGLKSTPYTRVAIDNAFTISGGYDPRQRIQFRLLNASGPGSFSLTNLFSQTLVMTENCLRGQNNSAGCPMTLRIQVDTPPPVGFAVGTNGLRDFQDIGFYSQSMQKYLTGIPQSLVSSDIVGTSTVALTFALSGYPDYEIASNDTIQVYVPYSLFEFSSLAKATEPAYTNVSIVVVPSPGNLTTDLSGTLSEALLWAGGFQKTIVLGGEAFLPAFADAFLNQTSIDDPSGVDPSGGWNTWKSCALPNGSIAFGTYTDSSTGRTLPNYSLLVLTFQACPQYTMSKISERIRINVTRSFLASGLDLATPSSTIFPLRFLITSSQPVFTWRSSKTLWAVDDVLNGLLTFQLVLQGGTQFKDALNDPIAAQDCALELGNAMNSSASLTSFDNTGWRNQSVRSVLLNSNSLQFAVDAYGRFTVLTVAFPVNTIYYTQRGENVTFTSIPGVCVISNNPVAPSSRNVPLAIQTRAGILSGYFNMSAAAPLGGLVPLSTITAARMREGGVIIEFIAKANTDSFSIEEDGVDVFAATVLTSIQCNSPQPFGFHALQSSIISLDTISGTRRSVEIEMRAVPQFAITTAETVTIAVGASWMSSRLQPTIVGNVSFVVTPSPGTITLVDGSVLSFGAITEDVVRNGDLSFTFAMLGDQWRQERDPYVAMFTGPRGEATGMLSLIDQLVPSIEFFNFTSTDTYQYMTMTLQASDAYDLSSPETIHISFSSGAASSGLAPQFQSGDGTFSFVVVPTPGRLVLSGQTYLTEKIVREGGARLLLTLFGETWSTAAEQCVRNGIRITTNDARDALLNSTIIPLFGSNVVMLDAHTVEISLSSANSGTTVFAIGSASRPDTLLIQIASSCVLSGITLLRDRSTLSIFSTRGELTLGLLKPASISEDIIRTQSIQIQVVVNGDSWADGIEVGAQAIRLLEGFSSLSSPLKEPSGFLVFRNALFSLNSITSAPDILKTNKSITIRTQPVPEYDISQDEVITFTVTNESFMADGLLTDPAQVSFTIKALPRSTVILYQPVSGNFVLKELASEVATLLSMPNTDGISAALLQQQGLLFLVSLQFSVTPSDADPRSSVELLAALGSLSQSYVQSVSSIQCVASAQSSTSSAAASLSGMATLCALQQRATNASLTSATSSSALEIAYWVIAASSLCAVSASMAIGFFLLHKRALSGALRSGSSTRKLGRATRVPVYVDKVASLDCPKIAVEDIKPMTLKDFVAKQREAAVVAARAAAAEKAAANGIVMRNELDNEARTDMESTSPVRNRQSDYDAAEESRKAMREHEAKLEVLLKSNPRASRNVQAILNLDL